MKLTKFRINMLKYGGSRQVSESEIKSEQDESKVVEIEAEFVTEAYCMAMRRYGVDGWTPISYDVI